RRVGRAGQRYGRDDRRLALEGTDVGLAVDDARGAALVGGRGAGDHAGAQGRAAGQPRLGLNHLLPARGAGRLAAVVLERAEQRVAGQGARAEAGAAGEGADQVAAVVGNGGGGNVEEDVGTADAGGVPGDDRVLEAGRAAVGHEDAAAV